MNRVISALFKSLLEHHRDATFVIEKGNNFEIIYHNDRFNEIIELASDQKNTNKFIVLLTLLSSDEQKTFLESINHVFLSNQKDNLELHLIFLNTLSNKWVMEISPVIIEHENTRRLICSIKETAKDFIPASKSTLSEEKYKAFFEQAPLSIFVLEGRNLITEYANNSILKIWGQTRKEVIGIPLEISRPEFEIKKDIVAQIKNIFETGKALYIDEQNFSTPTLKGYFSSIYQPLKNENDEVTSILVIVKDITDQVYARNELIKAKDILKLAMDAADMGSWNIDLNSKSILLSERAQNIYETNHHKLSINSAKAFIIDTDLEFITSSIKRALHQRISFNLEYQIQFGRPETKWIRAAGKAYYNDAGRAVYIAGTLLDISEQKKDELIKNDFIAMVSHELKTPLTSLSAYIQLLQYKTRDDKDNFVKNTLHKVAIQLNRVFVMIDGFLNVSLLESGKIVLNRTEFDLVALLQLVAEENRVLLQKHFIQVIAEEKIMINADQEKISSVLNNLINNAAKYSKKESIIAIKCEIVKGEVLIGIEDEGIGIDKIDQNKIFNRFYRVESFYSKTVAGFGIGLYICSEIINRHKGKIWVESETGKGSTFYFSLPL